MQIIQNRRHFLAGAAAVGAAGFIGTPTEAWAEPPPETTLRSPSGIPQSRGLHDAHLYFAGPAASRRFHRRHPGHGRDGSGSSDWIEHGEVDFDWNYPPSHIRSIAKGVPITVLSGLHFGCLELIANDASRASRISRASASASMTLTATRTCW